MPDRFTIALLSALNNSTEDKGYDWNSIEDILSGRNTPVDSGSSPVELQVSENRFAATISSGMARLRSV